MIIVRGGWIQPTHLENIIKVLYLLITQNTMKALQKLFWIHLTLCALLFSSSFNAFAAGGIGGYPNNPNDPDNPAWFIYSAEAGEVIQDSFTVVNNSDKTWIVDMYPADSIKSSGGGFALKQRTEKMVEMGEWVELEKDAVTLKPMEKQTINFTVTFPKDLNFGQTSGAILFEKSDPEAEEDSSGGVKLNLRTGIRIYQTTPGEINESLSFDVMEIEDAADGSKIIHSEVTNTGNISSTAKFITTITKNGKEEVSESAFLIERDDTFFNNIKLSDLPMIGQVDVDIQAFIKKKDGSEEVLDLKSASFYIIPWWFIAIIVTILLLIILIIVFFLRRKKKKSSPDIPLATPVVPAPVVASDPGIATPVPVAQHSSAVHEASSSSVVSRDNTVHWKKFTIKKEMNLRDIAHGIHHDNEIAEIAHVNNIPEPYNVPAGTVLLLPPVNS